MFIYCVSALQARACGTAISICRTASLALLPALSISLLSAGPALASETLSLKQALALAVSTDPWQQLSLSREASLREKSIVAGTLPEPRVVLGLANVPTDSFSFNQEGMTQVAVSLSQAFPAGDSLSLSSKRFEALADESEPARTLRAAKIQKEVATLWASLYQQESTISTLLQTRKLLESLEESIGGSYSSGFGRSTQQDLVQSQLELDRIDEKMLSVHQSFERSRATLLRYLPELAEDTKLLLERSWQHGLAANLSRDVEVERLLTHPSIEVLDAQSDTLDFDKRIAEEQYKPSWSINLGYGFRGEDTNGRDRSDLASISVSMTVPFFAEKKWDAGVRAASHASEGLKFERQLQLNALRADYQGAYHALSAVNERLSFYQNTLLTRYEQNAEAAMNAYASNEGGYAAVIKARVSAMNAQLEVISLESEQLRLAAELAYISGISVVKGEQQ